MGVSMSDLPQISADRRAQRDTTSSAALRQAIAAEQSADALEGIRQDFMALLHEFGQLQKTLTDLASRLK
jgi:hypothetical protein